MFSMVVGLILFIRDNIPTKELKQYKLPNDIEAIIIEIKFVEKEMAVMWELYPPPPSHEGRISYHLENISKLLDFLSL